MCLWSIGRITYLVSNVLCGSLAQSATTIATTNLIDGLSSDLCGAPDSTIEHIGIVKNILMNPNDHDFISANFAEIDNVCSSLELLPCVSVNQAETIAHEFESSLSLVLNSTIKLSEHLMTENLDDESSKPVIFQILALQKFQESTTFLVSKPAHSFQCNTLESLNAQVDQLNSAIAIVESIAGVNSISTLAKFSTSSCIDSSKVSTLTTGPRATSTGRFLKREDTLSTPCMMSEVDREPTCALNDLLFRKWESDNQASQKALNKLSNLAKSYDVDMVDTLSSSTNTLLRAVKTTHDDLNNFSCISSSLAESMFTGVTETSTNFANFLRNLKSSFLLELIPGASDAVETQVDRATKALSSYNVDFSSLLRGFPENYECSSTTSSNSAISQLNDAISALNSGLNINITPVAKIDAANCGKAPKFVPGWCPFTTSAGLVYENAIPSREAFNYAIKDAAVTEGPSDLSLKAGTISSSTLCFSTKVNEGVVCTPKTALFEAWSAANDLIIDVLSELTGIMDSLGLGIIGDLLTLGTTLVNHVKSAVQALDQLNCLVPGGAADVFSSVTKIITSFTDLIGDLEKNVARLTLIPGLSSVVETVIDNAVGAINSYIETFSSFLQEFLGNYPCSLITDFNVTINILNEKLDNMNSALGTTITFIATTKVTNCRNPTETITSYCAVATPSYTASSSSTQLFAIFSNRPSSRTTIEFSSRGESTVSLGNTASSRNKRTAWNAFTAPRSEQLRPQDTVPTRPSSFASGSTSNEKPSPSGVISNSCSFSGNRQTVPPGDTFNGHDISTLGSKVSGQSGAPSILSNNRPVSTTAPGVGSRSGRSNIPSSGHGVLATGLEFSRQSSSSITSISFPFSRAGAGTSSQSGYTRISSSGNGASATLSGMHRQSGTLGSLSNGHIPTSAAGVSGVNGPSGVLSNNRGESAVTSEASRSSSILSSDHGISLTEPRASYHSGPSGVFSHGISPTAFKVSGPSSVLSNNHDTSTAASRVSGPNRPSSGLSNVYRVLGTPSGVNSKSGTLGSLPNGQDHSGAVFGLSRQSRPSGVFSNGIIASSTGPGVTGRSESSSILSSGNAVLSKRSKASQQSSVLSVVSNGNGVSGTGFGVSRHSSPSSALTDGHVLSITASEVSRPSSSSGVLSSSQRSSATISEVSGQSGALTSVSTRYGTSTVSGQIRLSSTLSSVRDDSVIFDSSVTSHSGLSSIFSNGSGVSAPLYGASGHSGTLGHLSNGHSSSATASGINGKYGPWAVLPSSPNGSATLSEVGSQSTSSTSLSNENDNASRGSEFIRQSGISSTLSSSHGLPTAGSGISGRSGKSSLVSNDHGILATVSDFGRQNGLSKISSNCRSTSATVPSFMSHSSALGGVPNVRSVPIGDSKWNSQSGSLELFSNGVSGSEVNAQNGPSSIFSKSQSISTTGSGINKPSSILTRPQGYSAFGSKITSQSRPSYISSNGPVLSATASEVSGLSSPSGVLSSSHRESIATSEVSAKSGLSSALSDGHGISGTVSEQSGRSGPLSIRLNGNGVSATASGVSGLNSQLGVLSSRRLESATTLGVSRPSNSMPNGHGNSGTISGGRGKSDSLVSLNGRGFSSSSFEASSQLGSLAISSSGNSTFPTTSVVGGQSSRLGALSNGHGIPSTSSGLSELNRPSGISSNGRAVSGTASEPGGQTGASKILTSGRSSSSVESQVRSKSISTETLATGLISANSHTTKSGPRSTIGSTSRGSSISVGSEIVGISSRSLSRGVYSTWSSQAGLSVSSSIGNSISVSKLNEQSWPSSIPSYGGGAVTGSKNSGYRTPSGLESNVHGSSETVSGQPGASRSLFSSHNKAPSIVSGVPKSTVFYANTSEYPQSTRAFSLLSSSTSSLTVFTPSTSESPGSSPAVSNVGRSSGTGSTNAMTSSGTGLIGESGLSQSQTSISTGYTSTEHTIGLSSVVSGPSNAVSSSLPTIVGSGGSKAVSTRPVTSFGTFITSGILSGPSSTGTILPSSGAGFSSNTGGSSRRTGTSSEIASGSSSGPRLIRTATSGSAIDSSYNVASSETVSSSSSGFSFTTNPAGVAVTASSSTGASPIITGFGSKATSISGVSNNSETNSADSMATGTNTGFRNTVSSYSTTGTGFESASVGTSLGPSKSSEAGSVTTGPGTGSSNTRSSHSTTRTYWETTSRGVNSGSSTINSRIPVTPDPVSGTITGSIYSSIDTGSVKTSIGAVGISLKTSLAGIMTTGTGKGSNTGSTHHMAGTGPETISAGVKGGSSLTMPTVSVALSTFTGASYKKTGASFETSNSGTSSGSSSGSSEITYMNSGTYKTNTDLNSESIWVGASSGPSIAGLRVSVTASTITGTGNTKTITGRIVSTGKTSGAARTSLSDSMSTNTVKGSGSIRTGTGLEITSTGTNDVSPGSSLSGTSKGWIDTTSKVSDVGFDASETGSSIIATRTSTVAGVKYGASTATETFSRSCGIQGCLSEASTVSTRILAFSANESLTGPEAASIFVAGHDSHSLLKGSATVFSRQSDQPVASSTGPKSTPGIKSAPSANAASTSKPGILATVFCLVLIALA